MIKVYLHWICITLCVHLVVFETNCYNWLYLGESSHEMCYDKKFYIGTLRDKFDI